MDTNHKANLDKMVELAKRCVSCSEENEGQGNKDNATRIASNGTNKSYNVGENIPLYVPTQIKK